MSMCLEKVPSIESVMCFNDIVAYGVMEYLAEQNIKPGHDVGVIGFDDLDDSKLMSVPLSTVKIDADDIAKAVCEILKGDKPENLKQVPVSLIERSS